MSSGETLGMRYRGGPFDGDTLLVEPGTPLHGWPLAERVDVLGGDAGGHYEKVGESQLPDPVPGVMRGAEYEWRPDGATGDIAGAVSESQRVERILFALGFDQLQVGTVQQQIADLQQETALTWRDATDQVLEPIVTGRVTPSNLGGTDG